jgi:hypothetical protein
MIILNKNSDDLTAHYHLKNAHICTFKVFVVVALVVFAQNIF